MKRPSVRLLDGRVLAGVVVGVVIGVIGVGAVTVSPAAVTAAGSPAAITLAALTAPVTLVPATSAGPRRAGGLRRMVRDNYRVTISATGAGGSKDILYVRGSLAIGTGSITVTLSDGSTQAFTTDSTTVVRDKGQAVALSDLESGERAMVFGLRSENGSYAAKLIRCVRAAARPPKPNASPAP